jgi:hypothetical protein
LYFSSDNGDTASALYVASVRNLFAHNEDRNPIFEGAWGIAVNNVIFDYKFAMSTIDDDGSSMGSVNVSIVGNYLDETDAISYGPYAVGGGANAATRIHIDATNHWSGDVQSSPWTSEAGTYFEQRETLGGTATDVPVGNRADAAADAQWPSGLGSLTAAAAKTRVLASAGARPADRDTVDDRIVSEVTASAAASALVETVIGANADCYAVDGPWDCCTGDGTGDCPDQTWPTLAENYRALELPTDKDVVQASGYTNMEEWLHDYHYDVTAKTQITGAGSTTITGAGSTTIGE